MTVSAELALTLCDMLPAQGCQVGGGGVALETSSHEIPLAASTPASLVSSPQSAPSLSIHSLHVAYPTPKEKVTRLEAAALEPASTHTPPSSSHHGSPSPPPPARTPMRPTGLEADEHEAHWIALACTESDDDDWLPLKGTPSASEDEESVSSEAEEAGQTAPNRTLEEATAEASLVAEERAMLEQVRAVQAERARTAADRSAAKPKAKKEAALKALAKSAAMTAMTATKAAEASRVASATHMEELVKTAPRADGGEGDESDGASESAAAEAAAATERLEEEEATTLTRMQVAEAEPQLDLQSGVLWLVLSEMQVAVSNVVNRTGQSLGTPPIHQQRDAATAELVKLHRATTNAHRARDISREKLQRKVNSESRRLDALVLDATTSMPPSPPGKGQCYNQSTPFNQIGR